MKGVWRILAAAVCFLLAVREEAALRPRAKIATVFFETAVDGKRGKEICETEAQSGQGAALCFWGEETGEMVLCKETGQVCRLRQIFTEGNTELLMVGTSLLSWQQGSCYLDQETAKELFGTGQAEGQIVWSGEKSYTVRGTFESADHFMLSSPSEKEEAFFACSLEFADSGNLKEGAQQFLMRNGLTGSVAELTFLESLIRNLLLIFPTVLAVRLVWICLEKKKKYYLLPAGTVAAMAFWLLAAKLSLPADLIPTRWSDFSFWGTWWESEKQNLLLLLQSPMGAAHLEFLVGAVKTAVYGIGAVMLIL